MKIAELFRRDIARTIEEVIKVDLSDEAIVAGEIDEYVATDRIRERFEELADVYQDTIRNPSESTTIWVSGFFGSGKSSFAKMLGYALSNPMIGGRPAAARLNERIGSKKLEALLNTAHAQAPAIAVFLDLSTGRDVLREGESVVLPVYRTLLDRLGYSRNALLAELEFVLEGDGDLSAFEAAFAEVTGGKHWTARRNVGLARNEASHALHLLRPNTYPQADSWAKSATEPEANHNWFADRALELLRRRGGGARRLVFVVDEVGQYVARSIHRMLDLQGLAEACQKKRGPLWLVVTSQEKLDDVVDSLESRQVELARVQDRFPLRVDLLPSDIHEVTSRRVLDKTEAGRQAVRAALAAYRNKLAAHVRLDSPARAVDLAEDEFVRLYPLVPYQVQLLIDAVSTRRAQGAGLLSMGGSNRTIIKLAQQLVVDPQVGLGGQEVGAVVTVDRAAALLEAVIPTAWQGEISQVAERYGQASIDTQVMRAVALTADVPALPLTDANLAVLLHPSIAAESRREPVKEALDRLVVDDRLRLGDHGYQIQSPEQKDWEKTRRGKEPSPARDKFIRRTILRQALTGLSVTRGRTFRVELTVEDEKLADGEVALHIKEADAGRRELLRAQSREQGSRDRITWVYTLSDSTYQAIVEWHRSDEMIRIKDTPSKTPAEIALLGEERQRQARAERQILERLARDLTAGQVVFRGRVEDAPSGALAAAAKRVVEERLLEIYGRLDEFAVNLSKNDVLTVLRGDLDGLPDALSDRGIGLVRLTHKGHEFVTDTGPLADLVQTVRDQADNYGRLVTGALLERELGSPPRGAPLDVVRALTAAAMRAGLLEVTHQGARIANPSDARLIRVFERIPDFRSASFKPPAHEGPDITMRVDVAERLSTLTGTKEPHDLAGLAASLRTFFAPDAESCAKIVATLRGADAPIPEYVLRTQSIVGPLRDSSDGEVVTTAAQTWADLVAGRDAMRRLAESLDDDIDLIRRARGEVQAGAAALPETVAVELAELRDLLTAGDLVTHRGRIAAITQAVADARQAAADAVATEVGERLADFRRSARERFAGIDEGKLAEVMRPLEALAPPDDFTSVSLADLQTRAALLDTRAAEAVRVLEEIEAAGNLARIAVTDLAAEAITSEEELEIVLGRIREMVLAALAEGKQVRLQ